MTTGKTKALTRWTFVGKVTSLLFNKLSRLLITFLPIVPKTGFRGPANRSDLTPWGLRGHCDWKRQGECIWRQFSKQRTTSIDCCSMCLWLNAIDGQTVTGSLTGNNYKGKSPKEHTSVSTTAQCFWQGSPKEEYTESAKLHLALTVWWPCCGESDRCHSSKSGIR